MTICFHATPVGITQHSVIGYAWSKDFTHDNHHLCMMVAIVRTQTRQKKVNKGLGGQKYERMDLAKEKIGDTKYRMRWHSLS
jgi:hypothetical protein